MTAEPNATSNHANQQNHVTDEVKDAGEMMINAPFQTFYQDPVQLHKPTGFLQSLNALKPAELSKKRRSEIMQNDSQLDIDQPHEDNTNDIQESTIGEDLLGPTADFDNELSAGSVDERKPFRFYHPRPIESSAGSQSEYADESVDNDGAPGQFIGFDDMSADADNDGDLAPAVAHSTLKVRYSGAWKDGLTTGQVKNKAQDMIEQLCIVTKRVPWHPGDSGYMTGQNLSQILQNEIDAFVEYLSPTEQEHRLRLYVVARIAKVVAFIWPQAKVKVFGSFDTRLYLPSSDLDLVVFCDNYGGDTAHRRLAKELRMSGLVHKGQVQVIPARIPIVKMVDSVGQFSVDISFNMPGGVKAAQIIRDNIAKNAALRPLVIILKQFLLMRGMNEVFSGGLGSYGLSCMITSFLQLHPLIQQGHITQQDNLGVLLIEFLDLYGRRFAYDDVGIRVAGDGGYFSKYESALHNDRYMSLTIEDPEDATNDITRGTFNMRMIVKAFARAYDVLTGAIYELDERYVAQHAEFVNDGHAWPDYSVVSLLGTIVQVQQSVIEHRAYVHQKYCAIKELIDSTLRLSPAVEVIEEIDDIVDESDVMVLRNGKRVYSDSFEDETLPQEAGESDGAGNYYEPEDDESDEYQGYGSAERLRYAIKNDLSPSDQELDEIDSRDSYEGYLAGMLGANQHLEPPSKKQKKQRGARRTKGKKAAAQSTQSSSVPQKTEVDPKYAGMTKNQRKKARRRERQETEAKK